MTREIVRAILLYMSKQSNVCTDIKVDWVKHSSLFCHFAIDKSKRNSLLTTSLWPDSYKVGVKVTLNFIWHFWTPQLPQERLQTVNHISPFPFPVEPLIPATFNKPECYVTMPLVRCLWANKSGGGVARTAAHHRSKCISGEWLSQIGPIKTQTVEDPWFIILLQNQGPTLVTHRFLIIERWWIEILGWECGDMDTWNGHSDKMDCGFMCWVIGKAFVYCVFGQLYRF